MEYVYGTIHRKGKLIKILKTIGKKHSNIPNGSFQSVREYPDQTITDSCIIVDHYQTKEDSEGRCYDWYEITDHYRYTDKTPPLSERTSLLEEENAMLADAICELDAYNEERIANIENALCELDKG